MYIFAYMFKKQLYILIILMGISIVGIIAIQYVWIKSAIQLESDQFDHSVNKALNSVIAKLETKESVLHITQSLDFDDSFMEYDIYSDDTDIREISDSSIHIKTIGVISDNLLSDSVSKITSTVYLDSDSLTHLSKKLLIFKPKTDFYIEIC